MSLREKLLNSQTTKHEFLEFPEIKDDDGKPLRVKVKGLTYGDRTQLLRECYLTDDRLDMVKMMPRSIIATFYDPLNDQPIFAPPDNDAIGRMSPDAIEKAREVIWRVLGLAPEVVQVTEKNSEKVASSEPAST